MALEGLGEFGLIGLIREQFPSPEGVLGIGDDCSILPQRTGTDTLVSTDMLIEGSHFLLNDIPAYKLGWKSAAVNISDIAAMGGVPTGTFLSFALPKGLDSEWMNEFIRGYRDISERYTVPLLGGDTTSSPDRLCINVAVLGECPRGEALLRSGAKVGDRIYVTGTIGDSAAGLKVILEGLQRGAYEAYLVDRHYLPTPRVEEGIALRRMQGVHSMMDVSDGIGSDLRHILKASGVGAEIDITVLPLSDELKRVCAQNGWDACELALSGGEDYELLFTADESLEMPSWATCIGRIVPGDDIVWKGSEKDFIGFRHF